jgi:hypothetical protein
VKLPNGERAHVSLSRLTGYLLNPAHPLGKHKARVFASALGLDASGAGELRTWLLSLAASGETHAGLVDQYGQRFIITGKMLYKGREALVRTAWIVRAERIEPEFLTALVE